MAKAPKAKRVTSQTILETTVDERVAAGLTRAEAELFVCVKWVAQARGLDQWVVSDALRRGASLREALSSAPVLSAPYLKWLEQLRKREAE